MILIPEIETVVILVPRAGSKSIKRAIAETYPRSMLIYRHMEADGVPAGYDRFRKVGIVRHPVERLWSLYRYLRVMNGKQDWPGKWEPAYVAKQRNSAQVPFDDWIVNNEVVFTGPFDSADGARFYPWFTVRHALPENRKSQFIYLRPDLGTLVYRFEELPQFAADLGLTLGHHHRLEDEPIPPLSDDAEDHMRRFFGWDYTMYEERAQAA